MHHVGGQFQHEPVEAEHHRLSGKSDITASFSCKRRPRAPDFFSQRGCKTYCRRFVNVIFFFSHSIVDDTIHVSAKRAGSSAGYRIKQRKKRRWIWLSLNYWNQRDLSLSWQKEVNCSAFISIYPFIWVRRVCLLPVTYDRCLFSSCGTRPSTAASGPGHRGNPATMMTLLMVWAPVCVAPDLVTVLPLGVEAKTARVPPSRCQTVQGRKENIWKEWFSIFHNSFCCF